MRLLNIILSAVCAVAFTPMYGQSVHDLGKPFGMAVCTSLAGGTEEFRVTGGGVKDYPFAGVAAEKVKVLTSTGKDMQAEILDALTRYSVIVFDGSAGDFLLSKSVPMSGLSGKTLLGINGARLCTQWYVTDEVRACLDDAGVLSMSGSAGTGGYLSNGVYVSEEQEQHTRQILIDMFGNENHRKAGVFQMSKCSNIIVRNLKFIGPGSVDVGGTDLLQMTGSKHVWVDHCEFTDGMDGNFDITMQSDFVTVSWCTFSYTDRSYSHSFSNLVCSAEESPADEGLLNITFACNVWGKGCSARMPMARYGTLHLLNNFYDCPGSSSPCINARNKVAMLIEGNYFAKDVRRCFQAQNARAYECRGNIAVNPDSKYSLATDGTVAMPYSCNPLDASLVPEEVGRNAGATLFGNTTGVRQAVATGSESAVSFTLAGQPSVAEASGVVISNGRKRVRRSR
ncbi:MAG: hypothetical protein NC344_01730 [Bacteroidales bacterium]|nr:hypothetical protein [Bacteroidales bacterium]MCM1146555.1 hypothetical protein [Bacteroidales bacterium]MCM1205947.1 hypothetical protein [Bacillota bacterium]MCM1510175.1 hypothetical protein [Clostridium sp.]